MAEQKDKGHLDAAVVLIIIGGVQKETIIDGIVPTVTRLSTDSHLPHPLLHRVICHYKWLLTVTGDRRYIATQDVDVRVAAHMTYVHPLTVTLNEITKSEYESVTPIHTFTLID